MCNLNKQNKFICLAVFVIIIGVISVMDFVGPLCGVKILQRLGRQIAIFILLHIFFQLYNWIGDKTGTTNVTFDSKFVSCTSLCHINSDMIVWLMGLQIAELIPVGFYFLYNKCGIRNAVTVCTLCVMIFIRKRLASSSRPN